jgi:hypothetical protein
LRVDMKFEFTLTYRNGNGENRRDCKKANCT